MSFESIQGNEEICERVNEKEGSKIKETEKIK